MVTSLRRTLERWAPTLVLVGTILASTFTLGRMLQHNAELEFRLMVHVCRIEVLALHQSFEECRLDIGGPSPMVADPR